MQERKEEELFYLLRAKKNAMKSCLKLILIKNAKYFMVIYLRNKEKLHLKPLDRENYK